MLKNLRKSNRLSIHTKLRMYKSLVRPILLYGHESWYDNESISKKFVIFENKDLRRNLGVRWQDRVRNSDIRETTKMPYIDEFIMKSRWRWLGHALRRQGRYISEAIQHDRNTSKRKTTTYMGENNEKGGCPVKNYSLAMHDPCSIARTIHGPCMAQETFFTRCRPMATTGRSSDGPRRVENSREGPLRRTALEAVTGNR